MCFNAEKTHLQVEKPLYSPKLYILQVEKAPHTHEPYILYVEKALYSLELNFLQVENASYTLELYILHSEAHFFILKTVISALWELTELHKPIHTQAKFQDAKLQLRPKAMHQGVQQHFPKNR